jgi:GNAT superfamily N-acetyltransferase
MLDPPFTPVPPRIAAPADAAEIVRVVNLAYLVEAEMFHGERTTLTDVRERLGRPHAAFLVIDADPDATSGSLVGAVYVEIKDRRGYFGMLAVDPRRQGQGLGRVLVRAVEAYCAKAGCVDLDLDVVDLRTELPGFYGALGFTRSGSTPYPNPSETKQPVHLIQMTKPLG